MWKGSQTKRNQYPPVFIEALAYHEAGHAVMLALFELPIARIVIGPASDEPGFNGRVYLETAAIAKELPICQLGLMEVASEPAEKLAPNYAQFSTMHKTHRHLKPWRIGVRNDLSRGFQHVMVVYQLMGLAESTAKQYFKAEYRDLAAKLIELNHEAVRRLAEHLQRNLAADGAMAARIIRKRRRLRHDGLLERFHFDEATGRGPTPTAL